MLFLFGFNATGAVIGSPRNPIPGGPSWRTTAANRGSASSGVGRQVTFVKGPVRPGVALPPLEVAVGAGS